MNITGAQLIVKALKKEGVDVLFAYPGGQVIDLFDALYAQREIRMILPRHEQASAHAADGYARSTGKVGVCLVTSGPGATNLVTGIATAHYDSTPMVCFTGQVSSHLMGSKAFQEVDIVSVVRSVCKYAVTVRDRSTLGEIVKKAFVMARSGRPGVVVVDVPKDIQCALGDAEYPESVAMQDPTPANGIHSGQADRAMAALKRAKRPLFLLGGGVNIARANDVMRQLVEKTRAPVVTTIMGKGAIPTRHPLYAGNLGIHGSYAANMAVSHCDLLFSIGTRFNDRITGTPETFAPKASIIHVDIDPTSISRTIGVDIPIVADAQEAGAALLAKAERLAVESWIHQIAAWKKSHPLTMKYPGLTPQHIIERLNALFPQGIVVTDVGQNQLWTTQFLHVAGAGQCLTSGGFGTMGFGFPAAMGAKLGNPHKHVVVVTGDGGMQMNIQELATAVVERIPLTICILNNGYLGNVRQWQEMYYGKRYSGTCLAYQKEGESEPSYTPDFVRLAESYGAQGMRVTGKDDIDGALAAAKANRNTPTIIEFLISPDLNVLPMVPPGEPLENMIT